MESYSPSSSSSSSTSLNNNISPSRSYRNTPSHYKTQDVLATVKKFEKFTILELENYICRARDEGLVYGIDDIKHFLNQKFNWDCSLREDDIRKAYDNVFEILEIEQNNNDNDNSNSNNNNNKYTPMIDETRLPIVLKNNSWSKNILLCQIDDPDMNFTGDLGAIGRLTVEPNDLTIDLKGRQYSGHISRGPTVMLLNLSQQVGVSHKVQQGRVEVLTNEYCHLKFEKDTFGSMAGLYSGTVPLGGQDDDDYEDNRIIISDDDEEERDEAATNKKAAPKISTITNRKRKSGRSKERVKRERERERAKKKKKASSSSSTTTSGGKEGKKKEKKSG